MKRHLLGIYQPQGVPPSSKALAGIDAGCTAAR